MKSGAQADVAILRVAGIAARFGVASVDGRRVLAAGCFPPFNEVALQVNHHGFAIGEVLARVRGDLLAFSGTAQGAIWPSLLADLADAGRIRGASVGYRILEAETVGETEFVHRAELREVSIVTGDHEPVFAGTRAECGALWTAAALKGERAELARRLAMQRQFARPA